MSTNALDTHLAIQAVNELRGAVEANSQNLIDHVGKVILDLSLRIDAVENQLLERMIAQRVFFPLNTGVPASRQRPTLVNAPSLSEAFARLKAAAPLNWDTYLACLDVGTASYKGLPPDSCSTDAHPQSLLFKAFLRPYLRGYVLDVGCGPQSVPSYLKDFPNEQIFGTDPISSPADHPFHFISGVGEYLPFQDQAFDVVISGTTLDHYYLLDQGLQEAARVLQPGGHFVAWITEFVGAPPYDPYSAPMMSYDSEHMYHIDRVWFLPLMDKLGFSPIETIHFKLPFNYLFMSFVRR